MQPAADVIFTNLVEPELAVVVAQSAAFAGGIATIDKPENKSEALNVSEIDLDKLRPNLPMKGKRLNDSFT